MRAVPPQNGRLNNIFTKLTVPALSVFLQMSRNVQTLFEWNE
ncbi:hypothetical protein B425_2017 [Bacillus amyloliquefaciens]|nr:hypothetical protein B425_2017 [Bacillus amyloliquefaciens]